MRLPDVYFLHPLRLLAAGVSVLTLLSIGGITTELFAAPSDLSHRAPLVASQVHAALPAPTGSSTASWMPSAQDTLILGATGDIMLGSWLIEVLSEQGADYPYREILPVLQAADLLVGNLESPFLSDTTGVVKAEKTYTFAVPPGIVETLTAGGFDLVGLANNHILDFGPAGLFETWNVLD